MLCIINKVTTAFFWHLGLGAQLLAFIHHILAGVISSQLQLNFVGIE